MNHVGNPTVGAIGNQRQPSRSHRFVGWKKSTRQVGPIGTVTDLALGQLCSLVYNQSDQWPIGRMSLPGDYFRSNNHVVSGCSWQTSLTSIRPIMVLPPGAPRTAKLMNDAV